MTRPPGGHALSNLTSTLALLLLLVCGCGGAADTDPPVIVIGVDGLEWNVLAPLIRSGEMPALSALMEQGVYGKLETLEPTFSPIIWTTIATGKTPTKHGITHFVQEDPTTGKKQLFSNRNRRTKAVWNIYSDYEQTVHTIGWWMTFPAERVHGTMVSQTNTTAQLDATAVLKGTLLPGLPGQVYPPEHQPRVMEIVAETLAGILPRTVDTFGKFRYPPSPADRQLLENSAWSFRADTIYLELALEILRTEPDPDLLMVYFGGPDVLGHRFWRFAFPDEFDHPPSAEQLENYSGMLDAYYRYVDAAVGALVAAAGKEATVMVVSDHGVHGINTDREFPTDPDVVLNSGGHDDAPPGVFIAAGPRVRTRETPTDLSALDAADLPTVGTVFDIAPTLLALKGIPVGRDFDGRVLVEALSEEFGTRHPEEFVTTHDTPQWLADRPNQILSPQAESERMEQLRSLGYIQ